MFSYLEGPSVVSDRNWRKVTITFFIGDYLPRGSNKKVAPSTKHIEAMYIYIYMCVYIYTFFGWGVGGEKTEKKKQALSV